MAVTWERSIRGTWNQKNRVDTSFPFAMINFSTSWDSRKMSKRLPLSWSVLLYSIFLHSPLYPQNYPNRRFPNSWCAFSLHRVERFVTTTLTMIAWELFLIWDLLRWIIEISSPEENHKHSFNFFKNHALTCPQERTIL